MATIMAGKINSRSNVVSTTGNTNAPTMSSAGSQYFLSRSTTLLTTPLHRRAVPKETRRPEHQDHDEHGEDHDRRPPHTYVLVGHRPDDPDKEPPDHCPGKVAYAPEDRCRERVESLLEPHVEDRDAVEEPVHYPGGAGEDAAEEETDGDSAVHVDADHRCRLLVLRHGPHCLSLLGVAYEVGKSDEQRNRHPDHKEVLPAEDDRVRRQDVGVGDELGERDLGGAFPDEAHVLEDKRHSDRRYKDRQPRRIPQRLVRDAFDPHAEQPAGDHGHGHGYENPGQPDEGSGVVCYRNEETYPQDRSAKNGQPHEGADHEVVAVGEVDELDDPVDQRVAEGYERDDGPVGHTDDELRGELRRLPGRLHGKHNHERRDEDDGDARPPARGPDAP